METLQYYAPNLSGPATHQTPFSADNDEDSVDSAEDHLDEADLQEMATLGVAEHQTHSWQKRTPMPNSS